MNFEYSAKTKEWIGRVSAFMDKHVYPNLGTFEKQHESGDRWVTPTTDFRMANDLIVTPRGRQKVVLLKPMEFMNLSGFAVQRAAAYSRSSANAALPSSWHLATR